MSIITLKRFATVKKLNLNSFQLEVICINCKRRGKLWFNKDYKLSAHSCPDCYKRKLQIPIWLNKYKAYSIFLGAKLDK